MSLRLRVVLASLLAGFFVTLFTGSAVQATPASLCIQPIAAKHAVTVYRAAAQDGIITRSQAEYGVYKCLQQLSKQGYAYSESQLLNLSESSVSAPNLTGLQRFAGAITGLRVLFVLAAIVGVISFLVLFKSAVVFALRAFKSIPYIVYEILLYMLSGGVFLWALVTHDSSRSYIGFLSCVLISGALAVSMVKHVWLRKREATMWILAVVWCSVAMILGSSLIGFFGVAYVVSALGFTIGQYGPSYWIGFEEEDSIGHVTSSAFVLLAAFVVMRVVGDVPSFLEIFEFGALFLGSFVGYLGLLILASSWYDHKRRANYVLAQIVTISAGLLAIGVGSVLNIGELLKVGGTFFALYIIEKLAEIPVRGKEAKAALVLVVSSFVVGGSIWVMKHPESFEKWLVFVN